MPAAVVSGRHEHLGASRCCAVPTGRSGLRLPADIRTACGERRHCYHSSTSRRLAGCLHRWQQQRQHTGDDRRHHQQLHKRESGLPSFVYCVFHCRWPPLLKQPSGNPVPQERLPPPLVADIPQTDLPCAKRFSQRHHNASFLARHNRAAAISALRIARTPPTFQFQLPRSTLASGSPLPSINSSHV